MEFPAAAGRGSNSGRSGGHGPVSALLGLCVTGAIRSLPGLGLALGVATVATIVGSRIPLAGGPILGILIGTLISARKLGAKFQPGLAVAARFILQVSIVLLGAQVSLRQVLAVGFGSLPLMVGTLGACLASAAYLGRRLGIARNLRTLVGVGTGVCGASAIAAVTPVIGAADADVAFAVSTIFLFNVTAVLVFPILGHLFGLSQHSFGLLAGTAVNDMSSVVAASTTYGSVAANYAVVVKLTRTLLIIPICLCLTTIEARRDSRSATRAGTATVDFGRPRRGLGLRRFVPWFLIGFLVVTAANSAALIPTGARDPLRTLSVFLITMALSAIGIGTDMASFRRAGPRPLLLGGLLWLIVSGTSLVLQWVPGLL